MIGGKCVVFVVFDREANIKHIINNAKNTQHIFLCGYAGSPLYIIYLSLSRSALDWGSLGDEDYDDDDEDDAR